MKHAGLIVRWAGTVLVAVLLVVYPLSNGWYAWGQAAGGAVVVTDGAMRLVVPIAASAERSSGPLFDAEYGQMPPLAADWTWWFRFEAHPGGMLLDVPLWVVIAVVAAPTGWLWLRVRRRGRTPVGLCDHCGYDLSAVPGKACPECGHERSAPMQP